MPQSRTGAVRAYEIADAKSCYRATLKHWSALHDRGATESERKLFESAISQAEKLEAPGSTLVESVVATETARQEFKQLLGELRAASVVVARGMEGIDAVAERALKVSGKFPNTDTLLKAFMRGLDKPVKTYSARLAARGFGKEKQAQLFTAFATFEHSLKNRTSARGEQAQQTRSRERLFATLAYQTRYFREVGRLALRDKKARADFDRVQLPGGKKAGQKPVPAPAKAGRQAAAEGNGAAAMS